MKVTVIGGGIVGLSTAWALRRHNVEVTLVEQGPLPNPLASSVDQHRLIRYAYGAQTGYTRMVREAYQAWEAMWRDLGTRFYAETGTLVLSGDGDGWAAQSRAVLEAEQVEHLAFDAATVTGRWPMLDGAGIAEAYFCPSGGLLFAESIIAALTAHLRDRGVTFLTGTALRSLDAATATAVLSDGAHLEADRLLVAAGAWTGRLLPELAPVSRPSRQVVVYLAPPPDLLMPWHHAPMLLEIGAASDAAAKGFYLVPPRVTRDGLRTGLKIGDHRFGPEADPGGDREPRQDEIDAILDTARHRIAGLEEYRVMQAKTCFYDVERDERFQLAELGPRAFAFCGTSGHGFKFGPIIGARLAALLQDKAELAATARWAAGETV
ncbi:FAD-dependent oxidoreductase [Ferrovibrio sp.]|uniref:NAD(P)/FAD-dependent oxidoreductase n=1 Tax=Ferrovibrio sp. TaxID=1917215 RepID=UPI00311FAE0A